MVREISARHLAEIIKVGGVIPSLKTEVHACMKEEGGSLISYAFEVRGRMTANGYFPYFFSMEEVAAELTALEMARQLPVITPALAVNAIARESGETYGFTVGDIQAAFMSPAELNRHWKIAFSDWVPDDDGDFYGTSCWQDLPLDHAIRHSFKESASWTTITAYPEMVTVAITDCGITGGPLLEFALKFTSEGVMEADVYHWDADLIRQEPEGLAFLCRLNYAFQGELARATRRATNDGARILSLWLRFPMRCGSAESFLEHIAHFQSGGLRKEVERFANRLPPRLQRQLPKDIADVPYRKLCEIAAAIRYVEEGRVAARERNAVTQRVFGAVR